MNDLLAGRTAVVTGAGHGIGRATAELFAEMGATVVVADVDEAAAELAAGEISDSHGTRVISVPGDLTIPDAPAALIDRAWEATGALDVIVNAAGYNLNARAASMDDATWHKMLDIHVTTPFQVLRAAAPYLKQAREQDLAAGRERFRKIVNVSSIAMMGSAFQANYAAGKAAVVGLTKSLAKEWGELRVNVNAVAFGSIDTRLTRPRTESNRAELGGAELQLGLPVGVMKEAVASIPFGRIGTAREAAGGIALLCTPWSDWITGQVLVVSGGQTYGMSF